MRLETPARWETGLDWAAGVRTCILGGAYEECPVDDVQLGGKYTACGSAHEGGKGRGFTCEKYSTLK